MAVRRIPVVALLLGACAVARGQDPGCRSAPACRRPPAGPAPGRRRDAGAGCAAVVLVPTAGRSPGSRACRAKPSISRATSTCRKPTRIAGPAVATASAALPAYWVSLAFFVGGSQNLGDIDRGHECGFKARRLLVRRRKNFGVDVGSLNVHQPYHEIFFDTLLNAPLTVTTADVNLRMELLGLRAFPLDGLVGYRYAQLHEDVVRPQPRRVRRRRGHRATTQGGPGRRGRQLPFRCVFLRGAGQGGRRPQSEVDGARRVRFNDSAMSVASEFGARVGYQLGEGVFGTLGYTFFYLNNVARPGHGDGDFYLHGFTIGLETRF